MLYTLFKSNETPMNKTMINLYFNPDQCQDHRLLLLLRKASLHEFTPPSIHNKPNTSKA